MELFATTKLRRCYLCHALQAGKFAKLRIWPRSGKDRTYKVKREWVCYDCLDLAKKAKEANRYVC